MFKKIKKAFILFLLTFISIPSIAFAYSDYIIASGENIGIELKSKYVMVVGTYEVNSKNPAKEAGLKIGDQITSIDGQEITDIESMVAQIKAPKESIRITYLRGDKLLNTTSDIVKGPNTNLKLYKDENNVYKTGLYVKDSITGIGTLTFIDPNTKLFGALGHEITERTTGKILEIKDGKIYNSTVTGVEPSSNGTPGEKNARFYSDEIKGTIFENTNQGIFGNYKKDIHTTKLYKVAQDYEIKKGKAQLLTVLNGNEIKAYDIEILKINKNQDTKNILFEVTDPELLKVTNGIVQGMSGSPIIQGDYIIGAVTHVVVDNPQKGYGIFITNMLEEAEN